MVILNISGEFKKLQSFEWLCLDISDVIHASEHAQK